mmetsp:Transcript_48674/g.139763  ORF Transcript_48674/g.139763 Transcript_48674/m.139763 type:complete len:272 (+) Transcript_48674:194-1009(+)
MARRIQLDACPLWDDVEALFEATGGRGRQLDNRVQRNGHLVARFPWPVHHVAVDHPQDGLMGYDEQRLPLPLHLVRHGLEPGDQICVALAPRVSVLELVGLSGLCLIGELCRDLLIRHAVAQARIDLVQIPKPLGPHLDPLRTIGPIDLFVADVASRVDGPSHRGRPQSRSLRRAIRTNLDVRLHPLGKSCRILLAVLREVRVATDLPQSVVLGLPVPREVERPSVQVEVHQELRDARGQETSDFVHGNLGAIHHFDPTEFLLRDGFVGGL